MTFDIPKQRNSEDPFDKVVPIVQIGRHYDVYISDEIDMPSEYNELIHTLYNAYESDTFTLHINSPGGVLDSALSIINALKNTKAKTIASISGTVASAATIITLFCDEIVVGDYTAWMTHNYSGGLSGKGHELKAYQTFTDRELNKAFKEIHRGFFTDKEIEEIIEGKDFWIAKDEILARWDAKLAAEKTIEE
jgi:ATP-dependent protease ClpP protease subunit